MADTPTGIVTFLFTDIEGSTDLWERYPNRMSEVLERHDDILRLAVEDHDGHVFKTVGDAFCATFSHPRKALRAALAAQRALSTERWGKPIRSLRIRMALHTGYAELERDGDYFGPAVNRVARLVNVAHGEQVLLSSTTHDQVRDHPALVDERAWLVDLGEHRLKDLMHPERIFLLAVPDLVERFPPLRTDGAPEEVEERYRIQGFLGSGGFAKVYLARDEDLDQDVALKVLHPRYVDDEEFVERFKREAKNVAKLRSHPNVVPIYDRGEKEDGAYYMVMEYLPGGTLKELIEREGPLPVRRALETTLQIARALSEAHEQGVIHRDIKPENVLLTKRGDAKVADFGIAKAAEAATKLTRTGVIPGTPHYLSPEQVKGQDVSPQSDLYSLGVVLYEILTGELPFDGETTQQILNKHLHEQARPLAEMNPNVKVPKRVEAVTMRLLAKNPKERYPDAVALIADIERARDEPNAVVDDTEPTTRDLERATDDLDAIKGDTKPTTARVPDLTGQRLTRTRSMLDEASLSLGSQSQAPSDTVPEGEIVGQYPPAGTEVEANSSVSVTVSSGPSIVEVPDLANLNHTEASTTLAAAGLKLGGTDEIPSDTVTKSGIIEQEPAAGTKAEQGSTVNVTISSGPEETTIVPGLSDRSTEEADERASSNAEPVPAGSRTEKNRRVGSEDSSRQIAQGATVRSGKRRKLWIGVGLLCAVVAVGLIAALSYSLTGDDTNFTLASTLSGHSYAVASVAFSPDGSLLASSGTRDEAIKLWDPQSGEELQTLTGTGGGFSVAFSPDGSLLSSGGNGKFVKLWDPRSGEEIQSLTEHSAVVSSVAFSPDGSLLASGSWDGSVKLRDPRSGEELQTLSGHSGGVSSVAFSPDGSLLSSGGFDETVKLWNPRSGEELQTLSGHSGPVSSVAFSPDGRLLASGSEDDTVKLWNPQGGELLQTLSGHSDNVHSVAFSPDGRLLASGSGRIGPEEGDNTVKLWDPQGGELLQTLAGHSDLVLSVAFSPDGSLLASGSRDGTVKLWKQTADER